jgi:hypothetical protein
VVRRYSGHSNRPSDERAHGIMDAKKSLSQLFRPMWQQSRTNEERRPSPALRKFSLGLVGLHTVGGKLGGDERECDVN